MTANEFRTLALSLPETTEAAHMAHPDFRVAGKIFATGPPEPRGFEHREASRFARKQTQPYAVDCCS